MLPLCSGILAKPINTTIFSANTVVTFIVVRFSLVLCYLVGNDLHFPTKLFSKNYSNFLFICTRRFKNS